LSSWRIFRGHQHPPHDDVDGLRSPPRWREFKRREETDRRRGAVYQASDEEIDLVNAALWLRRPLLITGPPGTGKSSLIYAVALELLLGPVLRWPITSRSTLQEGLYRFDAIGRLQAINEEKLAKEHPTAQGHEAGARMPTDIGEYIHLGPLGTALVPSRRPRALLIDEIDKSDIDLPNDLLNIFEEGYFSIPELERLPSDQEQVRVRTADNQKTPVERGRVQCQAFPFVILTSNGERDFPAPFLRRCIRLKIDQPDRAKLTSIVEAHLGEDLGEAARRDAERLITEFLERIDTEELATDQLLNAVYLIARGIDPYLDGERLLNALITDLSASRQ
jgi:MoxR-like ATPase